MTTTSDLSGASRTPSGEPIMGVKFQLPKIRQAVLRRSRLLDLMSKAVGGPLTVINAPAGSGKTVLASSWASVGTSPGPVAWVSLDEEDDNAGVFWTYVLTGLARSGVSISKVRLPESETSDDVDRSLLVGLAAGLSDSDVPVVLILDNAEVLTRHQISDQLDFVIRHAAGQLRLVLITRGDPNLPLHQYRLDGSVTEIRFPDLAFTAEEARALLHGQDIEATDDAVAAFAYRTRGWAAGLRLAGSQLGWDDAGLVESDIAAYFRSEVLDAQPPEVRDFLLSTSVVEHLPAALAVHLSGVRDAPTTLRALALANTLVEQCADEEDCFRYHPLVRDLLHAELRQESAARQRRLHRRAAQWFEADLRIAEAVCQYAAAQDWRAAAGLLVQQLRVAGLLVAPPSAAEVVALAGMPASTPGPEAAVVGAALAWRAHDRTSCEKHLTRAEELLVHTGGSEDLRSVRLAVAIISGLLACWSGDVEGVLSVGSVSQELLSQLAAEGVWPPPTTSALIRLSTGCAYLGLGNLQRARGTLAAAGRTANVPGGEGLRAECLAQLALAEALSGRLVQASETAHRALALAERHPSPIPTDSVAEVALAWASAERGDSVGARACVERAGESAASLQQSSRAVISLITVRLLRARGDLAGALKAVEDGRMGLPPACLFSPWFAHRLSVAAAGVLTAQGRVEEASALVRQAGAAQTPQGLLACGWAGLAADPSAAVRIAKEVLEQPGLAVDVRVVAVLLVAAAELELGRQESARANVEQALAIAEPQGLRRPFDEVPSRLRVLLRGRKEIRAQTLQTREGPPKAGNRAGKQDVDRSLRAQPLTAREKEVLGYLAELLPTEEIAARMFVSVNTVKTHIRAILRKLSAGRRNEAVRRGRELGLL